MILAVDVGYGDVKAYSGEKAVKFPSAVAPYSFGRRTAEGGELYGKEKVYSFEGQSYLLGEQALFDENCKTTRSQEFIERFSPLFVYESMKRLGVEDVERLAVGIPLSTFVSVGAESFKERYRHRLKRFTVNEESVEAGEIHVFAQGHGIYIDYIAEKGTDADETVLVVDVGFNTVDILTVIKGVPSKKGSTTLKNKGVIKIISDLQEYLKETYMLELSEQATKDVLYRKSLKVYGNVIDLHDKIDEISSAYSSWLFEELDSQKGDFLQTADRLVIAGGGAYYIRHAVTDKYRELVYIPPSPEFANVKGYHLLSQMKE